MQEAYLTCKDPAYHVSGVVESDMDVDTDIFWTTMKTIREERQQKELVKTIKRTVYQDVQNSETTNSIILVEVLHVLSLLLLSVLWIVHDLTIIVTLQNVKYTTSIII